MYHHRPHFYPRSPCGERRCAGRGHVAVGQFLSTLSLRRATPAFWSLDNSAGISIHALLAESDDNLTQGVFNLFTFLSTLSLRRATLTIMLYDPSALIFLSTLSLRRATPPRMRRKPATSRFLSTLSLRRATCAECLRLQHPCISIHALLAESDGTKKLSIPVPAYFYPRSPCGERRLWAYLAGSEFLFLSTLSLRRATAGVNSMLTLIQFLSTLSLRRATTALNRQLRRCRNFYPRSPCGERRRGAVACYLDNIISIHALLAESDVLVWCSCGGAFDFYPRSPCGERRGSGAGSWPHGIFLSTLSLRRATIRHKTRRQLPFYFYPRSPCGERLLQRSADCNCRSISIHALLAESDTN